MNPAEKLCLVASGLFPMTGLVTGTWKYMSIRSGSQHHAHRYVSVAHQASLAYAFACLVLARLAAFSPYSDGFTLFSLGPVAVPVWPVSTSMVTLVISEFLGAGVLFWGFLQTQVFAS